MENKNLLPFSIEKVKFGHKVVTRDGLSVRLICTDFIDDNYSIIGLLKMNEKEERLIKYYSDGKFLWASDNAFDLFLIPKTKTLWYAIYHPYGQNTVQFTSARHSELDLDTLIGTWSRHQLIEKRSIEVPEL